MRTCSGSSSKDAYLGQKTVPLKRLLVLLYYIYECMYVCIRMYVYVCIQFYCSVFFPCFYGFAYYMYLSDLFVKVFFFATFVEVSFCIAVSIGIFNRVGQLKPFAWDTVKISSVITKNTIQELDFDRFDIMIWYKKKCFGDCIVVFVIIRVKLRKYI